MDLAPLLSVAGRNLALEVRVGNFESLTPMAREIVKLRPDLAFAVARPAVAVEARATSEFEAAFAAAARQKPNGMITLTSRIFNSGRQSIIDLAARYRLPTLVPFPSYARDGGLVVVRARHQGHVCADGRARGQRSSRTRRPRRSRSSGRRSSS